MLWFTFAAAATLDVPATYPDLPAAVAAASAGDTIRVAAGSWTTMLPTDIVKSITLEGDGPATRIGPLIINGYGVLARDLTLDGVGGLAVEVSGDLVLERVAVDAAGPSGGVLVRGALVCDACTFTDLTSTGSGGALTVSGGDLTLIGGSFTNNRADIDGGAIHVADGGTARIEGTRFVGNHAVGDGGAIHQASNASWIDIIDSWFCGNRADDDGGAIRLEAGGGEITGTGFSANTAVGDGGALSTSNESVSITHVSIYASVAAVGVIHGPSAVKDSLFVGHGDVQPLVGGGLFLGNNLYFQGLVASLNPGDLAEDPLLMSASDDCDAVDLRLNDGSPAIGAASDGGDIGAFPFDADGDGYGHTTDCDDADPNRYPQAPETLSDSVDQDCDGEELCFTDADADGAYGGTVAVEADAACALAADAPPDCDDSDDRVHPDADEVRCDGVDNDCDPATPDDDGCTPADTGFGDTATDDTATDDTATDDTGRTDTGRGNTLPQETGRPRDTGVDDTTEPPPIDPRIGSRCGCATGAAPTWLLLLPLLALRRRR